MKIAILTNSLQASGGAARIVDTQERFLRERGHDVRVFCPPVPWLAASPVVRLYYHLRDLGPRKELVEEMTQWRPDALVTHNLTGMGFGTPSKIKERSPEMRWIHILHDVQLFEPSGQLVNAVYISAWQRVWASLRRRALTIPDLVLSPTAWLLAQHERRGFFQTAHTHVLPNPLPLPMLDHVAAAREWSLAGSGRSMRLLYVGRLSNDKGTEVLHDVAQALSTPFELHVVGGGPEKKRLCSAGASVTCLGEQPPEAVERLMREADVLLVPSQIEENQPTVILEAARVGLPVIASIKGGIPETLSGVGILLDPADSEAWILAIEGLRQPLVYAEQSQKMVELARAHDPAVYIQRLEGFLTSIR